ncbi:g5049 [Coccomyxa viridis]|uniref:G5049 protein n=1 Tax=Coccomyxa viridis TaxID=1274662 RepID=A0ABP1FRT8_9CHLO
MGVQDILRTKLQRISKEQHAPREHLLSTKSLDTLRISLLSFKVAVTKPYVFEKLKRYATPVIAAAIAVFLIGSLLAVPLRLLARTLQLLSFGIINGHAAGKSFTSWLNNAVALVPLTVMLWLRTTIRRPLYKTLVHGLREVNPEAAAMLEASPRLRNPTKRNTIDRVAMSMAKVSSFLVLDMVIYFWHQLPWLGRLAGPVTQFLNMLECMSMPQAVILAALGFVGPLQWWTFQFVRLWRTSRLLGEELVEEWVARVVPPGQRDSWYRSNAVTITLFVAPQALLMQVPLIGPLVYVPMQYAAAWLLNMLLTDAPTRPPFAGAATYSQIPEPPGAGYGGEPPTRPASFMADTGQPRAGGKYAVGMHEHARDFHAATQTGSAQPSAPMYSQQQEPQDVLYPEIRH